MKVCIIGGGQSGIIACRTFVSKGHEVVVLEKCCMGFFSQVLEDRYFRWSTSRYMSGFSDMPMDPETPVWFTLRDYEEYLEAYKRKFDLSRHFRHECDVKSTQQHADDTWTVRFEEKGTPTSIDCDLLLVCSGLNQTPKYPDAFLTKFTGEVMHTDEVYRKMDAAAWKRRFEGKRVLLVGGGESAFDVGHILVQHAAKVMFTTKNYIEWFPEGQESADKVERCVKLPECGCVTSLTANVKEMPPSCSLTSTTDHNLFFGLEYSLPTPISGFWHQYGRYIWGGVTNVVQEKLAVRKCGLSRIVKCNNWWCSHNHPKLCSVTQTPSNLFGKPVTKRTHFMLDLHENKAEILTWPDTVDGTTVTCAEGQFDVDMVMCATGYRMSFPFLDPSITDQPTIKHMIPEGTRNLAFIGFARPTMGSIASMAEMQSWWCSMWFTNALPRYSVRDFAWARPGDPLNLKNDFVSCHVIGGYYMKDLALDMDIHPNFLTMSPRTSFRLMWASVHPIVYRFRGAWKLDNALQLLERAQNGPTLWVGYVGLFMCFHLLFVAALWTVTGLLFEKRAVATAAAVVYTYTFWH